jgi:hypothetical protein
MENEDIKLRSYCLSLACGAGHGQDQIVQLAKEFYDFCVGSLPTSANTPIDQWPPEPQTAVTERTA